MRGPRWAPKLLGDLRKLILSGPQALPHMTLGKGTGTDKVQRCLAGLLFGVLVPCAPSLPMALAGYSPMMTPQVSKA